MDGRFPLHDFLQVEKLFQSLDSRHLLPCTESPSVDMKLAESVGSGQFAVQSCLSFYTASHLCPQDCCAEANLLTSLSQAH